MDNNETNNIKEIVKKIEEKLSKNKTSFYEDILMINNKQFQVKDVYEIKDFTKYHDEEFIDIIFYTILQRAPDLQGKKNFLNLLRTGKLTKELILANIRYSSEGVSKNISILGLKKYDILRKMLKIPIFGTFIKIFYFLLRLSKIQQTLNNYEHTLYIYKQNDLTLEENIRNLKLIINKSEEKYKKETLKHRTYLTNFQTNITKTIESSQKNLEKEVFISSFKKEKDNILDLMYIAFEDKFRGTKEQIKNRLEIYIPYIKAYCKNDDMVLDVGCGRAEWLELLQKNNIKAKGLDLNTVMVQEAKELNFDVVNEDVISYLKKQDDNSLSAITGFHIIEHLPFEVMIELFQESLRVLKIGGMILFETPNPENILVGSHYFYNDPTHKNPLVPTTLEFIVDFIGFSDVKIKRINTYLDAANIKPSEDSFINNNFYNAMDFSIIGYKK